jgi:hypothetical protein
MQLVPPRNPKKNSSQEENTVVTYLAFLREFLTAAGGTAEKEVLEEAFTEKFEKTFSKADRRKWRNTLAWAVVASRNTSHSEAMAEAGLPAEGQVHLATVKAEGQRKHARYYVLDTLPSALLDTAKEQLVKRKNASLAAKQRLAPHLDPKRPWMKCPHCKRMTYFGGRTCVCCFETVPRNTRTKVYRR